MYAENYTYLGSLFTYKMVCPYINQGEKIYLPYFLI